MPRAAKKMKKPTDEFPPLRMVIEKGHLVPAFPLDFERLDSFRSGTQMLVWMTADGDRPLVRRWWATLGNYLKHTSLPWGDKETASAAIKLALAMIEPFKMPSGDWSQYPRSLSDFDDADLEGKIREMEQLLYQITGVDVETLRREAKAEFGDEPFNPNPPAADNDAGEAAPVEPPSGAAANSELPGDPTPHPEAQPGNSPADDLPPVPSPVGGAPDSADDDQSQSRDSSADSGGVDASTGTVATSSGEETAAGAETTTEAPVADLTEADRIWLRVGARMMLACQPEPTADAKDVLGRQVMGICDLMPKPVSNAALVRMETIRKHCMAVCKAESDLDIAFVAATALSSVADVTPPPIKMGKRS